MRRWLLPSRGHSLGLIALKGQAQRLASGTSGLRAENHQHHQAARVDGGRRKDLNILGEYLPSSADGVLSHGYFETASTVPAGSSFQEIPPPDWVNLVQKPIPAMDPTGSSTSKASSIPEDEVSETIVQGVTVPPRPHPPAAEECCMSGCAFCVYDIYAEELQAYRAAIEEARAALTKANIAESKWPPVVQRESKASGKARDDLAEGMDPTMAAFLALEKKLKKKQAPESSSATPDDVVV